MHSWIGPWAEATLLYVDQSAFEKECLRADQRCVIYDVGLGLAANALAAIEKYRSSGCQGELEIVSFENDLDGIQSALEHREAWGFLSRNESAVETLCKTREWREAGVAWRLLEGDFRETLTLAPPPDIVFWDFYDPRTCPELWSVESFARLRARCADRRTRIFTYSASTPTRLGMALAGFFVGQGRRTPVKAETSLASTRIEDLDRPLGREWVAKLRRSAKATPYGESITLEQVLQRLKAQPQFAELIES